MAVLANAKPTLLQEIEHASSSSEALALYHLTEDDTPEEEAAFAKWLSFAQNEADLQHMCDFFEEQGTLLNFRKELSQIFAVAEKMSAKSGFI